MQKHDARVTVRRIGRPLDRQALGGPRRLEDDVPVS